MVSSVDLVGDIQMIVLVAVISVAALVAITIVILRISTLLNSWQRSASLDKLEYASSVENITKEVFENAMQGFKQVFESVQASNTEHLRAVLDAVVGPQQLAPNTQPPDPEIDTVHEAAWMDERYWGADPRDPTDELLPDPPMEPDDLAHRAVSVRPGEGLIPHG